MPDLIKLLANGAAEISQPTLSLNPSFKVIKLKNIS